MGTDVRVDTACFPGWTSRPYYDSLLAKVIARGRRPRRRRSSGCATRSRHLRVEGVSTTAGFARDVLAHPDVLEGRIHTRWLEDVFLPSWVPTEVAA